MYTGLLTSILLAYLVSGGHAFQIHGYPAYYARLDPIVSPGIVSSHVHAITAPTNFGPNVTTSLLTSSKCGTMESQEDMSAYWVPAFYGRNQNGTLSALPYKGLSVYYLKVSLVLLGAFFGSDLTNPVDNVERKRGFVEISRQFPHGGRQSNGNGEEYARSIYQFRVPELYT
jgi:hypothetical protein